MQNIKRKIKKDGCKYCKNESLLNKNTLEYSGIEVSLFNGDLRIRTYPNDGKPIKDSIFDLQEIVNISYCPMCGKKIKRRKM